MGAARLWEWRCSSCRHDAPARIDLAPIPNDRFAPILLQKSAADDGRSVISLGAAGYDPPALTIFTQLHATRCTEPEWVAVAQLAMRAVGGSGRWQPEQIRPGRPVDHAVEAGRLSGCA